MGDMFVPVNGIIRRVSGAYVPVNGIIRKVSKIPVPVNGIVKEGYVSFIPLTPSNSHFFGETSPSVPTEYYSWGHTFGGSTSSTYGNRIYERCTAGVEVDASYVAQLLQNGYLYANVSYDWWGNYDSSADYGHFLISAYGQDMNWQNNIKVPLESGRSAVFVAKYEEGWYEVYSGHNGLGLSVQITFSKS